MNNLKNAFILVFTFILLSACGEDPTKNPILQEAFGIHNKAVEASGKLEARLKEATKTKEELQQMMNQMQVKAEPMDESLFNKWKSAHGALETVAAEFEKWKGTLVEIPGFEHAHDHGEGHDHDHDHDHGAAVKLTPEQMLAVQKESLSTLGKLETRVDNAIKLAEKAMEEQPGQAM